MNNNSTTNNVSHGDILVVDDNTSNLKFLTEILTKAGHRVRPATDGELALLSAHAKPPELILLDIKMPGMGGIEVCHRLKAEPETRDIPIIFLSALTETEMKVKALKEGGTDYITKPIEPAEVLARIETHLHRYRLQQKLATQSLELTREIEERKRAEDALQKAHDDLEIRVKERTAELSKANTTLHLEIAERKHTEEELREKKRFQEKLLNDMLTFVGVLDPDGNIIFVNNTPLKVAGIDLDDIIGKKFCDAPWWTYSDEVHKIIEQDIEHCSAGETIVHDIQIQTADGSLMWIEYSMHPIFDEDGVVQYLIPEGRDISRHKKIEYALKESENFLDLVVENIPDMIFVKDAKELRFVRFNNAGEELLGYSREELYGKNDHDFFSKHDADFFTENDRRVLATKKLHDIPEENLQTKDKGLRILHTKKIPLLDKDGTPLYLLGISEDITERKQAEDALKSSERNLALVQQVASVGSWTWDVINDHILWSNELYRICGIDEKDFPANYQSYLAMVHPDDRDTFSRLTETAFAQKEHFSGEYRIVRPDTKIINIYEQGVVVCDEEGKVTKLMGTIQDVTENKKLEEELFQAQKMEAIGTLAGGIAHDFNNILSAILGFAEMAKMEIPEGSQATKDIDQVITAGKRATELVKRILTFSRKTGQKKEPLHIDLIVNEALKMLRSSLPTTIDIVTDIQQEDARVLADPTSIHQIVMNLCTNSLQAMENEKGTLSINLWRRDISTETIGNESGAHKGSFMTLSVHDTGCGMKQEIVEKIFDPFFTTKEIGKGTGLGLSVIHGIVVGYGGFVQVESTPGQGTTFLVNLPVVEKCSPEEEKYTKEKELPTGTERILCVDDEPLLVKLNCTVLERNGYTVTGETQSLTALEMFTADPYGYDLVITDQTMPGMTGAEMAQAMMKIRPELPVILCTGYSSVLSKEETLALGIKRYQKKPVSKATLTGIVREVLDER